MTNEDNIDQECMKCGAVMFKNVRRDLGGCVSINTVTQAQLHQEQDDLYFKCPKCEAKNYVEMETNPAGLPELRFTQAKP
jgi:predicted nucleic-acid-binding Zn-ribbon protein